MTASLLAVRSIAVPVSDQDRTAGLLTGLGWSVVLDRELQPGFRWVELNAPQGGAALALVRTGDSLPAGIDTGIRLLTGDAAGLRTHLAGEGLDVGDLLDWPGVPLMFSFTDYDGNRFYVSE